MENNWRMYRSESNYTSFKPYQKKVKFNDSQLEETIETPFFEDVQSMSSSEVTNQERINIPENDDEESLDQDAKYQNKLITYIVLLFILITITVIFLKYFQII